MGPVTWSDTSAWFCVSGEDFVLTCELAELDPKKVYGYMYRKINDV